MRQWLDLTTHRPVPGELNFSRRNKGSIPWITVDNSYREDLEENNFVLAQLHLYINNRLEGNCTSDNIGCDYFILTHARDVAEYLLNRDHFITLDREEFIANGFTGIEEKEEN